MRHFTRFVTQAESHVPVPDSREVISSVRYQRSVAAGARIAS